LSRTKRPLQGAAQIGPAWVYVRDNRSGDNSERHLKQFTGPLQTDAYANYNLTAHLIIHRMATPKLR
jgi:hypothetical protein